MQHRNAPLTPNGRRRLVARVESVRLDLELREALKSRAKRDREAMSDVIRKALREYLATR